jgi:prevent-host-death family protein
MSTIIALKDFRLNTQKYLDAVESGQDFIVVKRSRPAFRLVPVDSSAEWETVIDFTDLDPNGISATDLLTALRT